MFTQGKNCNPDHLNICANFHFFSFSFLYHPHLFLIIEKNLYFTLQLLLVLFFVMAVLKEIMKLVLLFIGGCVFCLRVASHTHSHFPNTDKPQLIKDIYEKAVALYPEVLEGVENSIAQPYVKVNGQIIVLDSGFWELVKGWIRLYRSELQEYCPCNINEHELVKEAKNHIAAGFFYSKVGRPLLSFSENIIIGSYGISAKYGKTALILKASAEVAETLLSVFVGGKGVHVICNVIDAMILFLFRKSQIYVRVFSNSKTMNNSRLLMMFRLAWLNRLMRKAQQKVFFHLESVNINKDALLTVDGEGARKNKRRSWLNTLFQKATPLIEKIRDLDERLDNEQLSERKKFALLKKRKNLYQKIDNLTQASKNSFFGKRYKRWLLLRSRKSNSGYLKGTSVPDKITAHNWLWALSIQENILERALMKQAETGNTFLARENLSLQSDTIRFGLSKEFVEKANNYNVNREQHITSVERVLMDIENIFNPSLSIKERYLLVSILEVGLVGFFEYYIRLVYRDLSHSIEDINVWGKARLKWKLDRFIYYVFIYSDFLRTIALTKDKNKISSYKYESMENLLLFFKFLHQLAQFSKEKHTKEELLVKLNRELSYIKSFQVHRDKRTAFSWRPFSKPLPWCRNLINASL